MRCVLGLMTAGQMLGGCPLAGLCLPPTVSLCMLLAAVLPRHKPPCCRQWEVSLLHFFPLCFVHYEK